MRTPEPTDEMNQLRAARPQLDDSAISPDSPSAHALVEAIVTTEAAVPATARPESPHSPARNRRPRVVVAMTAGAAALAIGAGVVANAARTDSHGTAGTSRAATRPTATRPTSPPQVALVNIRTIAARSTQALAGTGRAEITFDDDQGGDAGTTDLSFSGHDVDMDIHFAGVDGRPGFDAQNRTVDGQFYLYTPGPDDVTRWYHDTTSTNSSVFDTDPRTLLGVLAPQAGFESIGPDTIDGVAVTHLHATKLDALPALNLSLGPIDAHDVTALDLWVGADNVVRRLDLTTETKTQEIDPKSAPRFAKSKDGTITVIGKDGHTIAVTKSGDIAGALEGLPTVTRTVRSSYSVRFFDIGAPISIVAPAGTTDIAGKG